MGAFPMRILLATDGSEDALLAARTASNLAARTGAALHVVHAHTPSYLWTWPYSLVQLDDASL